MIEVRIVFFSDVHGNKYAMDQFLAEVGRISYDFIVYGGDFCGYYYESNSIINEIKRLADVCLLGNHDKMFLEMICCKNDNNLKELIAKYGDAYGEYKESITEDNIKFLKSLSSKYQMICEGQNIVFVHGSIDNPLEGRIYPDTVITDTADYEDIDYVFSGHTHHKMIKRAGKKCLIVNPGSIGQQRDGQGCSYLVFDTITKEIVFNVIEYDVGSLIKDIDNRESNDIMKKRLIEVLLRKRDRFDEKKIL